MLPRGSITAADTALVCSFAAPRCLVLLLCYINHVSKRRRLGGGGGRGLPKKKRRGYIAVTLQRRQASH
ncbi:hypothetical protein GQ53DRAFT_267591 [Thozetella sp. PMI_491]|nr:hypothetical protein GQ53DRAFT_267591 [Thozetella sp. PMI_491]